MLNKSICFKLSVSLLFVCGVFSAQAEEPAFQALIVGTWCEDPADTGVCTGYTVFNEDGTTFGYGLLNEYNLIFNSWGEYAFEGDIGCHVTKKRKYWEYSSGNEIDMDLPLATVCSQVICLTNTQITYKWVFPELDEPRIKTIKKVSDKALTELPLYSSYDAIKD